MYTDDVSIFVLCHSDIEMVWQALERYKNVMASKINLNNTSSMQLGAWKRFALLGPFSWADRLIQAWGPAEEELVRGTGQSGGTDLPLKAVVHEG